MNSSAFLDWRDWLLYRDRLMISPADQRSLLGIYEIEFDCVNTNGQESDWTRQPYGSVGLSYADSFQARLTSRATFLLHATARYVPVRPQSTYPKGPATPLATSICEHPLPFLCACIETSFRVNDTFDGTVCCRIAFQVTQHVVRRTVHPSLHWPDYHHCSHLLQMAERRAGQLADR
jgi:hypothetical protein